MKRVCLIIVQCSMALLILDLDYHQEGKIVPVIA